MEKKADQSLCVTKEALETRLMPTKTIVRRYVIGNAQMRSEALYTSKVGLVYIGNSFLSL